MMRRILPAVGVLLVVAVAAGVIWFYAAGNVGEPTEVTAPLITAAAPDVSPATTEPPSTTARSAPASSESDDREDSPSTEPEPTAAPSEEPTETTVATTSTETTVPDVTVELELAGGTEARFLIFEELRGEPFTVAGVTTEVVARWGPGDVLDGTASTTVLRSEFDLSVPSVPFVANVADEIVLELDFIAQPGGLG